MSGIFGIGSPGTVSTASGGKVYGYTTIGAAAAQVAPANPARTKIIFHNPGTVNIYVAPASLQNTGANVAFVPSAAALGGCFQVFGGGWLEISGECQGAWQAFAATGTSNPLTVMESNI